MKAKSRVYTFLLNQYGAGEADKAMLKFSDKKTQYIQQGKK